MRLELPRQRAHAGLEPALRLGRRALQRLRDLLTEAGRLLEGEPAYHPPGDPLGLLAGAGGGLGGEPFRGGRSRARSHPDD
jgi:hypothetical protein